MLKDVYLLLFILKYLMEKFLIKQDDDSSSEISSISENENYNESDYDNSDNESENLSNSGIKDAVNPLTFFTSKELCYYKTIHKFFKNCNDKEIIRMLDIINGESEISLRVLDWFVTRYSKRVFDFNDSNQTTIDSFDVHISYKSELKSYKKRYFDPFRRRRKFYYPLYFNEMQYNIKNSDSPTSQISKDIVLLYTTLGQLNFFMWAISNNIINYVEKNLDQISKAMNTTNKDEKKKKQKLLRKRIKQIDKDAEKIKAKKENKEDKKINPNNVFNNYYDDLEDSNLVLDFD